MTAVGETREAHVEAILLRAQAQLAAKDKYDGSGRGRGRRYARADMARYEVACLHLEDAVRAYNAFVRVGTDGKADCEEMS